MVRFYCTNLSTAHIGFIQAARQSIFHVFSLLQMDINYFDAAYILKLMPLSFEQDLFLLCILVFEIIVLPLSSMLKKCLKRTPPEVIAKVHQTKSHLALFLFVQLYLL